MVVYSDELCHYGIRGMRWGIRRYQNKDGSLTAAGKKRYITKNHQLTGSGKKLQQLVRDKASSNRDILDEYDDKARRLRSLSTNPHARRLFRDMDKKYSAYKRADADFQASGSKKSEKKRSLALEKYEDAYATLIAANKRDNDRLYDEYKKKLADRTLDQLGSEVTDSGRRFVEELLGDYYKHELD